MLKSKKYHRIGVIEWIYEVLDDIKWIFIELPKFRKSKPNMNSRINQWLAFIDDSNKELVTMAETKNEVLREARKEVTYLTGDEEIQRLQQLREKWEMDRISEIEYEKKKAIKIGEKIGEKKGEKIGEKRTKIKNAKKMLEEKIPIEVVMRVTELTEEEIRNIQEV